jgi:putative nucleotidyltransferase with HDIG domain
VSAIPERLLAEPAIRAVSEASAGPEPGWLVGGTIRDALLDRPVTDVDLAVAGDPEGVARAVAAALGGPVFRLSERFGAWRAIDGRRRFVCDVSPLQAETIEADLAQRDFTVNAMAAPIGGREIVDPHGGREDLAAGVLRVLGEEAYASDGLRPLRLARLATELPLAPDAETERLTRAAAARVGEASGERVFAELKRIVTADEVLEGLALCQRLGLMEAVLPEVAALRDVEQSHFHHLDVYEHTLEVVRRQVGLEDGLGELFGELAAPLHSVLEEPLADELTRAGGLRLAALLHDVGKPPTRRIRDDGRVTFIGHDSVGEQMVRSICRRLRTSERLASFLGTITRTHLALGFLVHERPLGPRAVYRYLKACGPVEIEVTIMSCADRLATRGRNAGPAIAAHLEVAATLLREALTWRREGPPRPPVRGDDLARELGIEPGPGLGRLLEELEEARFAGEIETRDDAVAYARRAAPAARERDH